MKQLFTLTFIIIIFSSCEKENTETIDKSLLYGNWEKIEIELTTTDCIDYLEFYEKKYREKTICSSNSSTGEFIDYNIDGDHIVVNGNVVFKIHYLSLDLLKLTDSNDILYEYIKPNTN